jgi:uncharacterized protein YdaU (DUF1376 family)
MSETPFIKFYPSDFLGGTSGLSPAERGVYITLLCLIYEADGPIQRDDARLSRRCGAPKATFVRVLDALMDDGKIIEEGGMLSNRRAEKAIVDRQIRSQNAGVAASARWSAQGQKSEQKQEPENAPAMPPQCVSDASQKPELDLYTEANASDAKSVLWTRGVTYLCNHGSTAKNARSFIGKCLKDADAETVRAVFRAAVEANTHDPIPYITAALKPKSAPQDAVWDDIMQEKSA